MDLTFTLTKDEAQTVLDALVQLPYIAVAGLVQKIQQQASQQIES